MGIRLHFSSTKVRAPDAAAPSLENPQGDQGGVQGGVQDDAARGLHAEVGFQVGGNVSGGGGGGLQGCLHSGFHGSLGVQRGQGCTHAAHKPRTIAKRVGHRAKRVYVMHGRPLLSRVYRFFGLRHGTMMIAIHDLLWSSFVVFLLVLATAHTREVSRMVENDVQAHLAERAGVVDGEHHQHHDQHHGAGGCGGKASHVDTRSFYERYIEAAMSQAQDQFSKEMHENEVKLNNGLHIATAMTVVMVFGISMAGIDMIASMMLLAGAVLHVRQLMMPWLSLRLLEMMLLAGGSMVALFCYAHGLIFFKVFFAVCLIICVVFYHWLVAYSLHEHLCRLERTGLHHHTRAPQPAQPAHTCDAPHCPIAGRLYSNHLFAANAKTYVVPVAECHHTCGDTTGLLSSPIVPPMSAPPAAAAAPATPAAPPMPHVDLPDLDQPAKEAAPPPPPAAPAASAPPAYTPAAAAPNAPGPVAATADDEKDQFPV